MFLKRLSPRSLFSLTPSSLPSPYTNFIAQCSSSSPSHLTYPHSHTHSHPDSRNVRVSVWWDLENCHVPSGVNVVRGAQAITAAIESSGIKGPIQIKAFGDMCLLNQEGLSSTETNFTRLNLIHTPHDEKCNAYRSIYRDLLQWVLRNPPPAHVFLISSDTYFADVLHRLRMKNYNILLASKKESTRAVLSSAATIMWNFDPLVRGENLTGRYFNQPPDGDWYGQYEGPLVDAFTEEIQGPELRINSDDDFSDSE